MPVCFPAPVFLGCNLNPRRATTDYEFETQEKRNFMPLVSEGVRFHVVVFVRVCYLEAATEQKTKKGKCTTQFRWLRRPEQSPTTHS